MGSGGRSAAVPGDGTGRWSLSTMVFLSWIDRLGPPDGAGPTVLVPSESGVQSRDDVVDGLLHILLAVDQLGHLRLGRVLAGRLVGQEQLRLVGLTGRGDRVGERD